MVNAHSKDIQEVKLEITSIEAGWIDFIVRLGEQKCATCFSYVFDPLLSFKKWLEEISTKLEICCFNYDTEGHEIRWIFTYTDDVNGLLHIHSGYNDTEDDTYLMGYVNACQLVVTLYRGFRNYFASDKYKPGEWEIEHLWERLCNTYTVSYQELVDQFLPLNREELKTVMFHADPINYVSYPEAADKKEVLKWFIEEVLHKETAEGNRTKEYTAGEWHVPEDYDGWSSEKKESYVKKCLQDRVSSYSGYKPSVLQSAIIEQFLYNEE